MKYLFILAALFFSVSLNAQTVVSATIPLDSVNKLTVGASYRFFTIVNKDTVDFSVDKAAPCPVCPTCPVCPAQRTLKSLVINPKTNIATATYSDGIPSNLTLTTTITVK